MSIIIKLRNIVEESFSNIHMDMDNENFSDSICFQNHIDENSSDLHMTREEIRKLAKRAFFSEQDVKIETENPGMLEVPEDKKVYDLSEDHFKKLVKKKGLAPISRALTNLIVWNKKTNPKISKWADNMQNKMTAWVEKEREKNPDFAS